MTALETGCGPFVHAPQCALRAQTLGNRALFMIVRVIVGMVVIMQVAMIVMVMIVLVVVAVRVPVLVRVVAVGVVVAVLVIVLVSVRVVVRVVVLALEFVVAGLFLGTAVAIIAHWETPCLVLSPLAAPTPP